MIVSLGNDKSKIMYLVLYQFPNTTLIKSFWVKKHYDIIKGNQYSKNDDVICDIRISMLYVFRIVSHRNNPNQSQP